eukprot:GGOE01004088.1.p1 GENE.GGOE01004088.1~~GGOE01004088.1.p1  ORF type:complete len:432 (+),score=183.13 GGOE01004088.1:57-1352(+)
MAHRASRADGDRDVPEALRKEVERKQQYIDALHLQLDQQRTEARRQVEDLTAERDQLRGELLAVQGFKREKLALEVELQRLRENEAALRQKNERELSKLRYQSVEEKVRLKNEEVAMEQRFHQNVETRAYELLDEKTKSIHQQNKTLLEDKALLERELEQLMDLKKQRDEELRRTQRELELHEQSLQESAKQGCRLHREIKELQAKNQGLEETLKATVQKHDLDLAEHQRVSTQTLALREKQIAEAHHLLDLRTQELHRMRGLAQHIVGARNELEAFFNEALEYVRQQITLEDSRQGGRRGPKSGKAAPAGPTVVVSHPQTSASTDDTFDNGLGPQMPHTPESVDSDFLAGFEPILMHCTSSDTDSLPPIPPAGAARRPPPRRVDISELSWADKERVLRILFAKINSVQGKPLGKKKAAPEASGTTSFRIH